MPRTVYLLHFADALPGGSQHYVGQTTRPDVMRRIAEHRAGRGSRLTRRAVKAGVDLLVARIWEDAAPGLERELKRRGGLRRICPVCARGAVRRAQISKGRLNAVA